MTRQYAIEYIFELYSLPNNLVRKMKSYNFTHYLMGYTIKNIYFAKSPQQMKYVIDLRARVSTPT